MNKPIIRCEWCLSHPLLQEYHDLEWGVAIHEDIKWFEFITLDAFQAGLSWLTILKKRENFRKAFDGFDPAVVATYNEQKVEELMNDVGIIRNRLKILATINNAKVFLEVQKSAGSFNSYIWSFTKGKTLLNNFSSMSEIPARSLLSDQISKDMQKRGFKFCGSTIVYAFMQAAGIVNDHATDCFRHKELK